MSENNNVWSIIDQMNKLGGAIAKQGNAQLLTAFIEFKKAVKNQISIEWK